MYSLYVFRTPRRTEARGAAGGQVADGSPVAPVGFADSAAAARPRLAGGGMGGPFWVQVPAERPYWLLFALATASSGVRNVRTDSTGPKISSRAMVCAWVTPVKSVGANQ